MGFTNQIYVYCDRCLYYSYRALYWMNTSKIHILLIYIYKDMINNLKFS